MKKKKTMQKLVMQRKKEPVASTESHSIRKRNLVQEVRDKHDASDTWKQGRPGDKPENLRFV